jgi:hypothetical protein
MSEVKNVPDRERMGEYFSDGYMRNRGGSEKREDETTMGRRM